VKKIFLIILIFYFLSPANASFKKKVIENLENIQNISFDFEQTINEKKEGGNCVIQYPKKIYCNYDNINKKIMVSNGESLVIKDNSINQFYIYPLKKTPLNLILDKKFLIGEIKKSKPRVIDNEYLNFTIKKGDYKINLFFNNKTLNLIGWQTEDVYQNLVITFLSKIKINIIIDKNIFKLPSRN
jgi:outer membrane lipoprotein-sorting protein